MPQGKISDDNTKILVVIPKSLKQKADMIANKDGRSLSGWVRKLMSDAIEQYEKSDTE